MRSINQVGYDFLVGHSACGDGFEWAITKSDLFELWPTCPHGDWLIWYVTHLQVDGRLVVRAAAACARLALDYLPATETRPAAALKRVDGWCAGEADPKALIAAGRRTDDAFIEANLDGAAAAAFAAKAVGCVVKAAAWIESDRYRASQFGAKTCTWLAEAGGAAAKAAGEDPDPVVDALHRRGADLVRDRIPEACVRECIHTYLQSRHEPVPTR